MCIKHGTKAHFCLQGKGAGYRQSNGGGGGGGGGGYVKECPRQYLQNKFQDHKRCSHNSNPAMKYFYYKDNPKIKGHIYEKLNAVVV